jgi:hypothetical protein
MMTLADAQWSAPLCLIPRAHLEDPVSFEVYDDAIRIAFTEDARHTGWNRMGEWFDTEGQLGVGDARVEISALGSPDYEVHPYVLGPRPDASIEEPALDSCGSDGYLHAMGQTHAHSNLSICIREEDREAHLNYRFMQDVQHCDFGAITDHVYNMWHTEMLVTRKLAEYYTFPGEFVAIPAYEWTGSSEQACTHEGGPFGHVNPLYLEEEGDLPFYTPCDPGCDGSSLDRLWQAFAEKKIVTPPHHVADHNHPYAWQFFDPDFEPVIELFQDSRGSGEQPWAPGVTNYFHAKEARWAVDELKSGKRFGFIASADHHGLARAGILVTELTRSGIYEALMARRCFATTGIALRLAFLCNGEMMGSEVAAVTAEFELSAVAPEPIHEIQVIRNGEVVKAMPVKGKRARHTWQAHRQEVGEFWYCRVILQNGEMAWSSPIWLI